MIQDILSGFFSMIAIICFILLGIFSFWAFVLVLWKYSFILIIMVVSVLIASILSED